MVPFVALTVATGLLSMVCWYRDDRTDHLLNPYAAIPDQNRLPCTTHPP